MIGRATNALTVNTLTLNTQPAKAIILQRLGTALAGFGTGLKIWGRVWGRVEWQFYAGGDGRDRFSSMLTLSGLR